MFIAGWMAVHDRAFRALTKLGRVFHTYAKHLFWTVSVTPSCRLSKHVQEIKLLPDENWAFFPSLRLLAASRGDNVTPFIRRHPAWRGVSAAWRPASPVDTSSQIAASLGHALSWCPHGLSFSLRLGCFGIKQFRQSRRNCMIIILHTRAPSPPPPPPLSFWQIINSIRGRHIYCTKWSPYTTFTNSGISDRFREYPSPRERDGRTDRRTDRQTDRGFFFLSLSLILTWVKVCDWLGKCIRAKERRLFA